MTDPAIIRPIVPGVLTGPYAEITIGERHISIWTRVGCKDRIDGKRHGKLARAAAEQWQPHHPNPCLVPLDQADHAGRHHVFAKITVKGGAPDARH